ncbi:MAG: adenylate/guanylate cyclase domain-containing protein [Planctomycetes bacterium]|nr:adenylate/guanylate cyclase domain-containing protein [Planctomycetota bacterium]
MARITFQPDGKEIEAKDGESILSAAVRAGIPHEQSCGGYGRCSTCRVMVREGLEHCSEPTADERRIGVLLQFAPEIRLACQTSVMGPVSVRRLVLDQEDREITSLLRKDTVVGAAGLQRELAILFSDIRGFTAFSEALSPYDLIHVLNRYFYQVGPVVERHGGSINNFMGDGFMALFGLKDPKDAPLRAVRAGQEILEVAGRYNPYVRNLYNRVFRIGVGIHVGTAVVGAIGSQTNMRVTAIGDAVNFASRVEAENKPAGTEFLISQPCFERVKDHVTLGKTVQVHVRGKTGVHPLYEIKGVVKA